MSRGAGLQPFAEAGGVGEIDPATPTRRSQFAPPLSDPRNKCRTVGTVRRPPRPASAICFHLSEVPMIRSIQTADDNGARLRAPDEAATVALGGALARSRARTAIWLQGNLGTSKTTLTRGLLRALGHEGKVKSPTYTLIEPYVVSSLNLYHFDFYRFTSPDEYLDAGLDEYFAGEGVCIVEWPDKASPHLPSRRRNRPAGR